MNQEYIINLPENLTYGQFFLKAFAHEYNTLYNKSVCIVENYKKDEVYYMNRYSCKCVGEVEEESFEMQVSKCKNIFLNKILSIYDKLN